MRKLIGKLLCLIGEHDPVWPARDAPVPCARCDRAFSVKHFGYAKWLRPDHPARNRPRYGDPTPYVRDMEERAVRDNLSTQA